MKARRRIFLVFIAVVVLMLGIVPGASAAPADLDYEPFGNASVDVGGATLNSTNLPWPDPSAFGGLDFTLPFGQVTYDQILYLGTDYEVLAGNCGGGSPRFQLETASGNVFVYMGTAPNFTDCGGASGDTGNLLTTADLRCDTSQIIPGTQYNSCGNIPADTVITGISLVVDGGWSQAGGLQSLLVNPTVTINIEAPEIETLCASIFGGLVRASDDGSCTWWQEAVHTGDDPQLCVNDLSGLIRTTEGECAYYETPHLLSVDGGFWACLNPLSDLLRATESFDTCAYYEEAVFIGVGQI